MSYSPLQENRKSAITPEERTLRLITALGWLLSFPLLVAHGADTHMLFPALSLVPMTVSSVYGLIHMSVKSKIWWLNASMDALIATFLFAMLVPGWIFMAQRWRNAHTTAILGSYGTAPLMLNFCIHSYLALSEFGHGRSLRASIMGFIFPAVTCPRCRQEARHAAQTDQPHPIVSKEEYYDTPVTVGDEERDVWPTSSEPTKPSPMDAEDTPRPSTDDETARLL